MQENLTSQDIHAMLDKSADAFLGIVIPDTVISFVREGKLFMILMEELYLLYQNYSFIHFPMMISFYLPMHLILPKRLCIGGIR